MDNYTGIPPTTQPILMWLLVIISVLFLITHLFAISYIKNKKNYCEVSKVRVSISGENKFVRINVSEGGQMSSFIIMNDNGAFI